MAVVAFVLVIVTEAVFELAHNINTCILVVEVPQLLYCFAAHSSTYPHTRELAVHVISVVTAFAITAETVGAYVADGEVAFAQHSTVC